MASSNANLRDLNRGNISKILSQAFLLTEWFSKGQTFHLSIKPKQSMIGMSFLYYVWDIFFRQSLLSILKASDMETTGMRLPLRHCLFTWMAWLLYTYRVTQYVRTHIHVVIELALTKNAKPPTYYWFLNVKRKAPIEKKQKMIPLRAELFSFRVDFFIKKWTLKKFYRKVLRRENWNSVQKGHLLIQTFADSNKEW